MTAHEQRTTSLLDLGDDILSLIAELLNPADARSLSLVNSVISKSARYISLRSLRFDTSSEGWLQTSCLLSKIEDDNLLPAVRELDITDSAYGRPGDFHAVLPHDGYIVRINQLSRMISKMTGLCSVNWQPDAAAQHYSNVPQILLHTLSQRSRHVKLYTQLCAQNPGTLPRDGLLHRLKDNHNLYSLDIQVPYSDAIQCLTITRPLKLLLLSCPNLKILKLDIRMESRSCVIRPWPHGYCGMGIRRGEKLAQLHELYVFRYPFGTPTGDGYTVGYRESVAEETCWAEIFDWSRLRKLNIDDQNLAWELLPQLTSVTNLRLIRFWPEEKAVRFLTEIPSSLEHITVAEIPSEVMGIRQHGSTLRSFVAHDDRAFKLDWTRGIDQNHAALTDLRATCPHLERLAIDIPRLGDWPWETLDLLASFPCLQHLTLWFDMESTHRTDYLRVPCVTFPAVAILFVHLHDRSRSLRHLTVHTTTDNLPNEPSWGPSGWHVEKEVTFTCALSERDDASGTGKFTVKCAHSCKDDNDWMQARLEGRSEGGTTSADEQTDAAWLDRLRQKIYPEPRIVPVERSTPEMRLAWEGQPLVILGPPPFNAWGAEREFN